MSDLSESGDGQKSGLYACSGQTTIPPALESLLRFLGGSTFGPEAAMSQIGDRALSDFVSVREAATRAGLTRSQVTHLLRQGTIEGVKVGWSWLVYWPSLSVYLASGPKPGPKPKAQAAQVA